MIQTDQIEIPLSKTTITMTFLGAVAFVILGLWFLINPLISNHSQIGNSIVIYAAGVATVIFFGFAAITIFRKFSDNKAGLIIDKVGITDNSSGVSAGLILWTDVQEIKVSQVMNQKFVMLIVSNPKDYLDKVTNPLIRNAMKMNYKTYGTPISISANTLKTDFDKLYSLLTEKMNEYKS